MMKHVAFAGMAALGAAFFAVSLHYYGAHDIGGFFAAVAGCPGLLVSGIDRPINPMVFTAVNWLFYFIVIEAVAALPRKLSTKAKSPNEVDSWFAGNSYSTH
jgi:hypothetical protein